MKIYHAISIDLAQNEKTAALPTVIGVEGDSGTHVLELHLLCGGEPWTIPEDVSVLISYARHDGTGGTYDTLPDGQKAWQIAENVLYVELAQTCFAVPTLPQKEMQLTVTLLRANQQLTTRRIPLAVQHSLAGSEESDIAYTSFTSLIHQHIGDLSLLKTENTSNIVGAVNEALWECKNSVVSVDSMRISEAGELLVTLTDGRVLSAGTVLLPNSGVFTVCGKTPDETGNVAVTAEDTAALPLSGGTMTGNVNMGGHTVTGLADPANDTDAVSKAWVESNCGSRQLNRNLLDNWYFVDPINQRSAGEYDAPGYTFDRWINSANIFTYLGSTAVSLTCLNAYANISQRIDEPKRLNGRTVTASVLLQHNGGDFLFSLQRIRGEEVTTLCQTIAANKGIVSFTYTFPQNAIADGDILLLRMGNDSTTFQEYMVIAAKLELGTQQTLAYQENGAWMLCEFPDRSEQSLRCQRYFQVFTAESLRPTYKWDFRPPMREQPTLSIASYGNHTFYAASAEL